MALLLLFAIFSNFYIGIFLQRAEERNRKNLFLLGIFGNLALLGFFKYAIFFTQIFGDVWAFVLKEEFSVTWKILLPIGISFYTFHNISYLVEIYQRKIVASQSLLHFSIYDLFFPLLLAGPIERPNSLLPQIETDRNLDPKVFWQGLSLFCYGIFLKAVIADQIAKGTSQIVKDGFVEKPGILLSVAFAFAFQVYADFSGYSLCARGLAKMAGFRLMNNFHRPFFATSPVEFWKRWHISLSTWLRDYVYIPLGGNRVSFFRQNVNIMIVWVLGGLWHGATYGYLIWGIYLGACIVVYNVLKKFFLPSSLESSQIIIISIKILGWFCTFTSFALGLLLFQWETWENVTLAFRNILAIPQGDIAVYTLVGKVALFSLPIILFDLWQAYLKTEEADWHLEKSWVPFGVCFLLGFSMFCYFSPFEKQEFFYFQF